MGETWSGIDSRGTVGGAGCWQKGRAIIEAEAIYTDQEIIMRMAYLENMSEYNSDRKSSLNAFAESRNGFTILMM